MKHFVYFCLVFCLFVSVSCGNRPPAEMVYSEVSTPEEVGLDLRCLTNQDISVLASTVTTSKSEGHISWYPRRRMAISPDGTQLVHLSRINNQDVAVVRNIASPLVGTQRTFRPTTSVSWGVDNKLYFPDDSYKDHRPICAVSSTSGTLMQQFTSGNNDFDPVLCSDGHSLFFSRFASNSSSVWCYDLKSKDLRYCCPGSVPYPVDKSGKTILCVRNDAIWIVDYENGQESMVYGSKNTALSKPILSPDGKWILFEGESYSPISKGWNLDLFVVRIDGTDLTQLTFHPMHDQDPIWSKDGKKIYFISNRGNSDKKYNIWCMNFPYK